MVTITIACRRRQIADRIKHFLEMKGWSQRGRYIMYLLEAVEHSAIQSLPINKHGMDVKRDHKV